jgi:CBS domain-containing protein
MTAFELINASVAAYTSDTAVKKAAETMDTLNISFLPVVEGQKFLGLVSYVTVSDPDFKKRKLKDVPLEAARAAVYKNQHFFDVLATAQNENTTVVAVLDEYDHYVGAIWLVDVLKRLGSSYTFAMTGGIIVLKMQAREFSLVEISRLVEGNDAKIIGLLIEQSELDKEVILVTLKINKSDLGRIIATFERFSYEVYSSFHQTVLPDIDQERLNMLLKYLSI